MTEQELRFVESVKQKIKQYKIPVSVKDAFNNANKKLTTVKYTSGVEEVVDTGIEWYLCSMSPGYFIDRYCYISVPNMGIIPFGMYYFQRETIRELNDYKKYVFLKTRQCITEENYVMTNRGYISIKDVKVGDTVETIIEGKSVFVNVEDSFYNGKKETCRILTNAGSSVECTLDHPIFTKRGWVEAGDITIKDEIVSIINKGSFGTFELDSDEHASFIGYYLADGRYKQPSFTNTNLEYINEMYNIGSSFENCFPHVIKRKDDGIRKQAYDIHFVSKTKNKHTDRPIKNFLNRFGLDVKSENRCLTTELLNLNEKQMSILLNRLYAGDGWITYKKDTRRQNYIQYEIGIGSPCFTLIKQLEYILQTKYGIHCYISEEFDKRNKNGKRFWKLRIGQKKSVIDFVNKIGIKGKTDTKEIQDLLSKEKPYKTNQSFEKVRKITKNNGLYDVYDITTQSSNFLTNGLLVHNCGISTLISFYCLWRCLFRTSESIAVVSKSKDAAQAFVSKIKITLTMLPPFLNVPLEVDNMSHLVFKNTSEIKSEARSPNAGRSATLSLLVLDEAAFYGSESMARQIVGSAQPTLTRTGGSLIIISTPNGSSGEGSYYFDQVNQLRMSGNTDREKLLEIDWFEVPDIEGIFPQKGFNSVLNKYIAMDYFNNPEVRKEMRSFFSPIEISWKTNPWLKAQHDDLNDALFLQEIMHNFVIMGNSVFGNETMDKMKARIKEPILVDMIGNRVIKGLWIWKKPEPRHRYIAGVDVAKGSSLDSSAIEILDAETYEQVAEYSAHVSTPEFSRIIKIVANYYNQAFVVIECNGIGEAVFNGVYHDQVEPYNNLYKQKLTRNGITVITGWITDVKTRQLITNQLIDWFNVDELFDNFKVYSSRLYTQMSTWIWGNGNRPDHADGAHDDNLIALSLTLYNRDRAINSGESFIVGEDGKLIDYSVNDRLTATNGKDNKWDFLTSEDEESQLEAWERKNGIDVEHYNWLVN